MTLSRRELFAISAGAASLSLARPALAQRAKVFRFGHNLPAETVYHKAIQMFADEVAKHSSNKLKVEIYPNSQLGSMPEMLSNVRAGSLGFSMAVPAWYSSFMKPIDVFTLPYIVGSVARMKAALDGSVGVEVTKLGEAAGFHVMGYWLIGARHIVNNVRPVNKPEDCAGLKLRVINSQVYIQTFRALGASTVALDPSELYIAMQQGVVTGFEYALPDFLAYKFYEVTKYLSLDAHTTDFFLISTNKSMWDGLGKEEQDIFRQSMTTAMDYQWKAQPADIDAALAKLRTLMTVNDVSSSDKDLFIKATRPVYGQFESSIGKDFLALCMKELA